MCLQLSHFHKSWNVVIIFMIAINRSPDAYWLMYGDIIGIIFNLGFAHSSNQFEYLIACRYCRIRGIFWLEFSILAFKRIHQNRNLPSKSIHFLSTNMYKCQTLKWQKIPNETIFRSANIKIRIRLTHVKPRSFWNPLEPIIFHG